MIGFFLPLLIRNGENIIWMLLLGLIVAFIGSIFMFLQLAKYIGEPELLVIFQ